MPTAEELILQHPVNTVYNTDLTSSTDKNWARTYAPLQNLHIHTTVNADDTVSATFDPYFIPPFEDEQRRINEPAQHPNARFWRFETESDIEHFWNTEISDVVLAAWARYPALVQTSHTKPLSEVNIAENVDSTYGLYIGNVRVPVAVGEIKRNIINPTEWQTGNLRPGQVKLARELRGYADKYQCPQIFCWDGRYLVMLQFRAQRAEAIRDANCPVDCWVIPAARSTCTLRYALYRLLVQGLRRCQGLAAPRLSVGTLTEHRREFFTGRPVWRHEGQSSIEHPEGYVRQIDPDTGALYWGNPLVQEESVWETAPLWEL